jgi:hypothetical protein
LILFLCIIVLAATLAAAQMPTPVLLVLNNPQTSLNLGQVGIVVESSNYVTLDGGGANPNGPGIGNAGAGTINKQISGSIDIENSSRVLVTGWELSASGLSIQPDWITLADYRRAQSLTEKSRNRTTSFRRIVFARCGAVFLCRASCRALKLSAAERFSALSPPKTAAAAHVCDSEEAGTTTLFRYESWAWMSADLSSFPIKRKFTSAICLVVSHRDSSTPSENVT